MTTTPDNQDTAGLRKMLAGSGYSEKTIDYYINKPHMGILPNADLISDMTGTCGDTMEIFLDLEGDIVANASYEVMGCPGAISAAMAVVDLIKGKTLEHAKTIGDNDVFKVLEEIPEEKHHCIQLAVKTLHKAIKEYEHRN